MRNAPLVAPDVDIAKQSLRLRRADIIWKVIGGIDPGGCCGHRALRCFSNFLLLGQIIIRVRFESAMPNGRRRDGRCRFPAAAVVRNGSDRSPADSAWRRRSRAPDCRYL